MNNWLDIIHIVVDVVDVRNSRLIVVVVARHKHCAVANRTLRTGKKRGTGEDETQVAHDFWLTRNGHGAGFWDRTYNNDVDGKKGDKLTKIAEKFGGSTLYVGDDGKIYSFDG